MPLSSNLSLPLKFTDQNFAGISITSVGDTCIGQIKFQMRVFMVKVVILPPNPKTKKKKNIPFQRMYSTAYSVPLQLPSESVGRLLHPQPEDMPCNGSKPTS